MECSGFYFHYEGDRLLIGAGIHTFTKQFYSEAILDYAFTHHKNMAPIHRWLKKALKK